jgi:hypothetical protein
MPIRVTLNGCIVAYGHIGLSIRPYRGNHRVTVSNGRLVSVLLVEDETLIRMMIAGMIEELGHAVVAEAGNIADVGADPG